MPELDQPLGLTIHSLPSIERQAEHLSVQTRTGRFKLLLLFLVCAAPVIASYFTYYVIRPDGRRNYGDLVEPQRPMPTIQATDWQGRDVPLASLRHQWLIVTLAASGCDARCERNLYLSRQLRESLGKDKDRVDWVWLRTDAAPVPTALASAIAQAQVLQVDGARLAQWLSPAPGQALEDHLYVVDPIGNWMMRFPADLDAARARRDLERLMRASSSWDRAGRP